MSDSYEINGAASPLSPVGAKLFGADVAGNVGYFAASGFGVRGEGVEAATVVPYRVFCQLADGKYLCSDTDASYGKSMRRLWTLDGNVKTGVGTKANLTNIDMSTGNLLDASGTATVSGTSAGIHGAWQLSNGDIIFVAIGNATGGYNTKSFLFRATQASGYNVGTDAGSSNKKASLNLGTDTGIDAPADQVAQIRILHSRSLCEVITSVNGSKVSTLILAEYNVATGRVTGAANDQVVAWKSTDNGASWTKFLEFNTDGTHRFDHFHAVVQDPYTRIVYFLTGDQGDECAVMSWDGRSNPPIANATLAQIASTPGWGIIYGDEFKRFGDLAFAPDGIFTLPDVDTEAQETGTVGYLSAIVDRGLKYVAAINSFSRVDNIPPLIFIRTYSGTLFCGSLRTQGASTTDNPYMYFWASGNGADWEIAAKVKNYYAATGSIKELFQDINGLVIASGSYGQGLYFTPEVQSGTSVIFDLAPSAYGHVLTVG